MSNDLEQQLRAALQRVDPQPGFTQRVMAHIAGEQARRWRLSAWLPVALAASTIFGAILLHAWQVRHERQGAQARQQLLDALRVTGAKLDLAYRVVNAAPLPATPGNSTSNDTGA
jgi:hypothetical protein